MLFSHISRRERGRCGAPGTRRKLYVAFALLEDGATRLSSHIYRDETPVAGTPKQILHFAQDDNFAERTVSLDSNSR